MLEALWGKGEVRVFCGKEAKGIDLRDRLEASCGSVHISRTDLPTESYDEFAYVTCPPWREITDNEWELMQPYGVFDPGRSIGLTRVQLPASLGVEPRFESFDEEEGYLFDEASRYSSDTKRTLPLGIYVGPADAPHTTVRNDTGRLIGLHVDSFDGLTAERRHLSRNRLCINLGAQDRYFLFVNIPFEEVWSLVGGEDRSRRIVENFFHHYPEYPIMRLRVCPGEAYIAPTENLIHDGSSAGSVATDVAWMSLGFFSL